MKRMKKKNILYLVSSKGISRIGDIMFDFANNTFLAGLNPSSLSLVAIYQSLESVIGVLFNLFGGVIADILAFMSAFSGPSYKAFTKEIVKKDHITKLNSYLETTSTIIKVTIPMVAIFLYNILGIHGVLLLDGFSFLIAASLIFFIVPINEEVVPKEKMTIGGVFSDLKIGFKYVYSHKPILIIIILSSLVNFFLAAYNLLLPYSNQMFGEISDRLCRRLIRSISGSRS